MSGDEYDRFGAEGRQQEDSTHPGEAEPEMIAYRAAGQAAGAGAQTTTDGEVPQGEMPTRSMNE
jgi:hypothetical protein